MAVVGVGVAQVGVGESPNSVLEDIPLACQKENLTFCFWADWRRRLPVRQGRWQQP